MRAFLIVAALFLAPVGDVVARECTHVVMMPDGTTVCNDQGGGGCDGGTDCSATVCADGQAPALPGVRGASCTRECAGTCIIRVEKGGQRDVVAESQRLLPMKKASACVVVAGVLASWRTSSTPAIKKRRAFGSGGARVASTTTTGRRVHITKTNPPPRVVVVPAGRTIEKHRSPSDGLQRLPAHPELEQAIRELRQASSRCSISRWA